MIDASLIKSGDYLAIARFDGLDPMIMWGTGGRTGHSAVCVWDNGTLYVVVRDYNTDCWSDCWSFLGSFRPCSLGLVAVLFYLLY